MFNQADWQYTSWLPKPTYIEESAGMKVPGLVPAFYIRNIVNWQWQH